MKISMAIFFIFSLNSCSLSSADKIKPQFFPDFFTGLTTKIITKYESANLDYDLTSTAKKNVHFSNCLQVEDVQDKDILMSEYHLLTMLKLNCKAMKKYTQAGNSNKSYLHALLVDKDVSNLPATAYPFVSDYDRKTRLGKNLKNYQKKLVTKTDSDGAIDVETETDNLLYQVVATGDFNNDKIQDALIRIDWQGINSLGKGSKLVIITKIAPEVDYQEINLD